MFDKIDTDKIKIERVLGRMVKAIFPSREEAIKKMREGKKLKFYLGIDPTSPDIHLGHTTNLLVLKGLIELGHEVILLIGDFTAAIGDPSGKENARRPLSEDEIKTNMKTYLKQVHKVLPEESFRVEYNSKWLERLSFREIVKLAGHFTVQQMIVRDMFQERIKNQKAIGLNEFLYPLMQGYDSVAMEVDGEVGGNDQTFNMLAGRDLAKSLLGKDKIVIATKLLEDPQTGKKLMNKSEGGLVSLNDSPQDMFGKIMAMPDTVIMPLYLYATEIEDNVIEKIKQRFGRGENPMILKKELASELVKIYHGQEAARRAREDFEKVFSKGQLPEEINELAIGDQAMNLVDFLAEGFKISKSEVRRLVDQKAITINGQLAESWGALVKKGDIIKAGPRRFIKAA